MIAIFVLNSGYGRLWIADEQFAKKNSSYLYHDILVRK
jgi:hypothetical protein